MRTITRYSFFTFVLLTSGTVFAQTDNVSTQLDALQKRIEQAYQAWQNELKVNDLSTTAANRLAARNRELDRLYEERNWLQSKASTGLTAKANDLNGQINLFKATNAVAASNISFLNNVAQYNQRDTFELNRERLGKEWEKEYGADMKRYRSEMEKKIDEAFEKSSAKGREAGYRKVGTHNPYTGEYYLRFYDVDGKIDFAVYSEGVDNWDLFKKDVENFRRRLVWSREEYLREANDISAKLNKVNAAAMKVGQELARAKTQAVSTPTAPPSLTGTWSSGQFYITFPGGNRLVFNNGYGINYDGTYSQIGDAIHFSATVARDSRFTFRGTLKRSGDNELTGTITDSRPGNVTPGQLLDEPVNFIQTYGIRFTKR